MRLVSLWLASVGRLPKHLFGLVSFGFLDVTHTAGGNDAMVEERGWESWKQSHQCDWLSGQRPNWRQKVGGRENESERERECRRNRKEVGIVLKPFKCPLEGSGGCQICWACHYCLPAYLWLSSYTSVIICFICPFCSVHKVHMLGEVNSCQKSEFSTWMPSCTSSVESLHIMWSM